MKRCPLFFVSGWMLSSVPAFALEPGDLMIVGYRSLTNPDSLSIVTWVDLEPNESFLVMDGEYDGEGDGSGEGVGGGRFTGNRSLVWTNTSGSALTAGEVIVFSGLTNSSASVNVGTVSGGFGLTNQGEQLFLAQGTLVEDGGDDYLDGDLLFGLDFEGTATWGESSESELPEALDVARGNLSVGHEADLQYAGGRSSLPLSSYPDEVVNASNWATLNEALDEAAFVDGEETPVVVPDELGEVSEGLWFFPKRLNNSLPILDEAWMRGQGMTADEADNINGPSCVALPDWLPAEDRADPTAKYYLYFANHQGKFIRMAWATSLEGPWTGYQLDSGLSLDDRGVLSLGTADVIAPGNGLEIINHIASPQVLVDDVNERFIMYYHGPSEHEGADEGQSTFVATSGDGLDFRLPANGGQAGHGTYPVNLGESYFRVFEQAGNLYAVSNTGDLWESPDPSNPWTPPAGYNYGNRYWNRGSKPFTDNTEALGWPELRPRHFAVMQRDQILYAFFTNKAARPERVLAATFDFGDLGTDYTTWHGDFPHQEILRAEEDWEGAQYPALPSEAGSENDGVNQLRDPEVLVDADGRIYLFYCGQGENAIGLARLVTVPQVTGNTEVTTGQDEVFAVALDLDVTEPTLKIEQTEPTTVEFNAEGATIALSYSGAGGYSFIQSGTVEEGTQSYQLAHSSLNGDETLTLPQRYYARPGAELSFKSRLANSTDGQLAEVQVSFDGDLWQTIWNRIGGEGENSFSRINLDLGDLEGRVFEVRFRYFHDVLRNASLTVGSESDVGWFFDEVASVGLEEVTLVAEGALEASSFTLDGISPILNPHLSWGEELEDRFLLSVAGLYDGESTGYGKPFVLRVRSSYEDFLATYFSESDQGDESVSGLNADPEGDGLTNLMEHAFGTNPNVANRVPVEMGLSSGEGVEPFLAFPWNPSAGVSYFLQMSPDLGEFSDVPSVPTVVGNDGLLAVELRPDPEVTLAEKAFFRLRVQY